MRLNPTILRLALSGSRQSWGRAFGIIAGVAIGVTLFLLLFGAYFGLAGRELRSSWLNTPGTAGTQLTDSTLFLTSSIDRYDGANISRLGVASTPNSTVAIPGVADAPGVGEFYASPALVELINSVPEDQLGARFGTLIGTLPDSVLMSPDSLVAVMGQAVPATDAAFTGRWVSRFTSSAYGSNTSYQVAAVIGAIAVLFPVLLLVGIVTDLGAAQRRERFSTLRLLGASPATVTAIAAIETLVTTAIGAILGSLLAVAFRPLAASLSINGGTFYLHDLAVAPSNVVIIALVTVAASTAVAAWRVARSGIGPLGSTRAISERVPRALRLVPLVGGIVVLAATVALTYFTDYRESTTVLIIGSFVLIALGLIIGGPYLTLLASRLLARRATRAPGVMASNRIQRTPVATFRAVSGLVIAVFVVSVFAGAATTINQDAHLSDGPGFLPLGTVVANTGTPVNTTLDLDALKRVEGVTGVAVLYSTGDSSVLSAADATQIGFVDLPGTPFVSFSGNFMANSLDQRSVSASSVTSSTGLPALAVLATTDGSTAAIERARTWLEISGVSDGAGGTPGTRADAVDQFQSTLISSFATLAYLGIGITTLIAGISLAVATVGSALDRRRVLGLLRLMGMPVGALRRMVTFEAAVPLFAVVALSVALGWSTAWVILTSLTDGRRTVDWPDPLYYLALGGSLLLAVGAVLATFGTIRRGTVVSSTRFE